MRIGYNRTTEPERFAAVILAAGLSSRMEAFKPLLMVDGRTALTGLVETMRGAGVEDIIVVTGHNRERLLPELDRLRVDEAYNRNYEEGMFTSIKTGLAKAREAWPEKIGYMIVPVDHPIISIQTVRALMEAEQELPENDSFFVPTYEGKKGHPLLVPASRIDEILSHDGSHGLKGITDSDPDAMIRVSVNDEGCVMDMDTPEGHEEIVAFVEKGFRRDKLSVLAGRKRVIMVRHGQTMQHREPMFIGQYDVPLDEEGRTQAVAAADKIIETIEPDVAASEGWVEGISIGKEPLPPLEKIFCSDLSRARETAEMIAGRIRDGYNNKVDPEVVPLKGLREISLGAWDGRPIEEIREKYPEEYRRRGDDLFTFKIGNDSENFYDLQYRVVKELRKILASDDSRNIIIVSHSGTIRAMENNLKGNRIDDEWDPVEKGGVRIWESPPVP